MPKLFSQPIINLINSEFQAVHQKIAKGCCEEFWYKSSIHENKVLDIIKNIQKIEKEDHEALINMLIECVETACRANDDRMLHQVRFYTSPYADFLLKLRTKILEELQQQNPQVYRVLSQKANEFYITAEGCLKKAKDIRTGFTTQNTATLQSRYSDAFDDATQVMGGRKDPTAYYAQHMVTAIQTSRGVLQNAEAKKKEYQAELRDYDKNMRSAWALGGGNNERAVEKAVKQYGLTQTEDFHPRGTWWNLTPNSST